LEDLIIMCVAIPSRVVEINNDRGVVDLSGVRREVSLLLLDEVNVGDYVIVHAGFAISRIDESAARESLEIFRKAGLAQDDQF